MSFFETFSAGFKGGVLMSREKPRVFNMVTMGKEESQRGQGWIGGTNINHIEIILGSDQTKFIFHIELVPATRLI